MPYSPERLQSPEVKQRQKIHSRNHYLKNKNKIILRAIEGKKKSTYISQTFILEYLQENPCVDCGEKDPIVLDFDHINPCEKKFSIGSGSTRYRGLKSIKEEILKCEVRCANCHRRKTYLERGFKNKG